MSKFTPGPWQTNELERSEALIVQPCATEQPPICLVDRQPNAWDNANLIAAAPEMYEALKKCAEEFAVIHDSCGLELIDTGVQTIAGRACDAARAALAKANGGQQ